MSKKEKIIGTALILFNKESFNTVGVDRIINEAKVAKMTFYKYFPSKEILIEACLERLSENQKNVLNNIVVNNQDIDYIYKLKVIYEWHYNWLLSEEFNGCIFQKAIYEIPHKYPSAIQPILDYRIWLYNLVKSIFINLNAFNYEALATLFISILDGMIIDVKVENSTNNITSTWEYFQKFILINSSQTN